MTISALAIRPRSSLGRSAPKSHVVITTRAHGPSNRPLRPVHKPLPAHEHAEKHHIYLASRYTKTRRRLQKVESLEASGVVACKRIREFAYDVAADLGWKYGWKMKASERIGLNYRTLWNILRGVVTTVNTATVDRVAKHSGVPVSLFYDNEM